MYNILSHPKCVLLFIIILLGAFTEGFKRHLDIQVNPGCDLPQCKMSSSNQSAINLVHVAATSPNSDTVHYIWSTINLPSIIVAQTSCHVALVINWTAIQNSDNGALWFTEEPVRSIGLVLTQLWSYVDKKDITDMAKGSEVTSLNVSDFLWKPVDDPVKITDSIATALISSSSDEAIFRDSGTFNVEFSAGASAEQSQIYPHLGFTSNSTQMRILFNNLAMKKKGRFAAEFMAVASGVLNDTWTPEVHSSIDDEYSPGVFKVNVMYPPCEKCEKKESFLMWKPVAYLGDKPTVVNSSDATMSKVSHLPVIPSSIVSMLFNDTTSTSNIAWNMTFGTSGDGFYERTKYTAWSVMVGTGQPVFEKLSVLAKVVIAVGLGAPCVIMFGGGIFLCYKKCRKDDDDELLLDE